MQILAQCRVLSENPNELGFAIPGMGAGGPSSSGGGAANELGLPFASSASTAADRAKKEKEEAKRKADALEKA